MEQSFEQGIPIPLIIAGFALLLVFTQLLRRKLRRRALARQGQLAHPAGEAPTIEKRLSANRAWASGEIRSLGLLPVVCLWTVALVWNVTFGVSFIKMLQNNSAATGPVVVLGIFAVLGVVPLIFAVRFTIRHLAFGSSRCCIRGKAGILGQEMAGIVRTPKEVKATGNYTIDLSCIETYTVGSGKNSRTESRVHWQGSQAVPHAGQNSRAGIPFSFSLPNHPPETGYQLARGQVSWQLKMHAPVKGVDYSAVFIVPVFQMG